MAARTSSLPEAGGAAALYFDPTDADELAARLADVLDDADLVARLRDAGPAQARRFSWARAGQATAAVYDRALAEAAGGGR